MLEVSVGIGFAFFNSARAVGRQHLLDPYKRDLKPLRDKGFAAMPSASLPRRTRGAPLRPETTNAHPRGAIESMGDRVTLSHKATGARPETSG